MTFDDAWAHQKYVRRLLSGWCQNQFDVDDIVQNVMLRAYRSISSFRGDSRITTWLYRIARNEFATHCKRNSNVPECALGEAADPWARGVQMKIFDRESLFRIFKHVRSCSRKQQRTFYLVLVKGFSYQEAAQRMGVHKRAVGVRINRIRTSIRNRFLFDSN